MRPPTSSSIRSRAEEELAHEGHQGRERAPAAESRSRHLPARAEEEQAAGARNTGSASTRPSPRSTPSSSPVSWGGSGTPPPTCTTSTGTGSRWSSPSSSPSGRNSSRCPTVGRSGRASCLRPEAGRGKNHIVDAAVKPLPPEFYFAFEIASGQSLYYTADEDPEFLKHTFAYPNEIEGAEALWEFLRPMLSKGWAKKIVTAKDADGNMTTRTIIVEGPVTIAIPTIRNKTDEQLQTRLLVAELPDYPGRVKHHAAAVSEQLLPDAAATDYSREQWLWQEGLRQLTDHRRVVFPSAPPRLRPRRRPSLPRSAALGEPPLSHGHPRVARAEEPPSPRPARGRVAIEAIPDDYEAAYRIFTKVCKRTVVNLSDTHRKILGALYDLQQQFPNREGFTQREIAKEGKDVPPNKGCRRGRSPTTRRSS